MRNKKKKKESERERKCVADVYRADLMLSMEPYISLMGPCVRIYVDPNQNPVFYLFPTPLTRVYRDRHGNTTGSRGLTSSAILY